jgi:aminopeptidase N
MKISIIKIIDFFYLSSLFLRFASWIEFLAVDHVYPEYDIWTQFVSDKLSTCMIPDALHNSHPIEMPIKKPTEIDEIFDDITYEKGFDFYLKKIFL